MYKSLKEFQHFVKNKKVTVVGIGISNLPLIKILVDAGAIVSARDKKTAEVLGDIAISLTKSGVKLQFGENYLADIDADIIFRSPGIRYDLPQFTNACKNGAVMTTEMEVFFEVCPAKILAITGSDGKTTTTTLTHEILSRSEKKCYLGGNIGKPLLSKVAEMTAGDYVVLELSSFQLHTMKKSPHRALITNITPNHLDWHTDYDEYISSKKHIFQYQNSQDRLVLNLDSQVLKSFIGEQKGELYLFSRKSQVSPKCDGFVHLTDGIIYVDDKKILDCSDIRIPGVHNIENYMAAIALTYRLCDISVIPEIAREFNGVEHRIEFVRELNEIRYYNSSTDSSPNRSMNALNVFESPIVICGGKDKGIPFEEYGDYLCSKAKAVIILGKTKEKILLAMKNSPKYQQYNPPVLLVNTMEEAVGCANSIATEGDTVILSPACTSYDMYNNFEERGNHFKRLVNKLE